MVTYDEFEQMVSDIVKTLPEEFFQELSGGVMVEEQEKQHPKSAGQELSIMGQYCKNRYLGRCVVIYYGSFMKIYGAFPPERLKEKIRKTILHEFRHHLESLAGERDLEVEDAIQIARYKSKKILDE